MIIASALALFGITVWTVFSHKHVFIALTDKHVILGTGTNLLVLCFASFRDRIVFSALC